MNGWNAGNKNESAGAGCGIRTMARPGLSFLSVYEPLIYRVARRMSLQDADAREVTQEVLNTVADAVSQWKPTSGTGSFRRWLFRVARNRALNLLERQSRHPRGSGDSNVRQVLEGHARPDDTELFSEEYRRQLFRHAAEQIRSEFTDRTWRAFWWTSVDGRAVPGVAAELAMSVGAVYTARSRVLARLKSVVVHLDPLDEFNEETVEAG